MPGFDIPDSGDGFDADDVALRAADVDGVHEVRTHKSPSEWVEIAFTGDATELEALADDVDAELRTIGLQGSDLSLASIRRV